MNSPVPEEFITSMLDPAEWADNNPASIVHNNAEAVRAAGLKIYIEVAPEDAHGFHRGIRYLHNMFYDNDIPHEYRYVHCADHVDFSLAWRLPDGFGVLNRILNLPSPDPVAEGYRKTFRSK